MKKDSDIGTKRINSASHKLSIKTSTSWDQEDELSEEISEVLLIQEKLAGGTSPEDMVKKDMISEVNEEVLAEISSVNDKEDMKKGTFPERFLKI